MKFTANGLSFNVVVEGSPTAPAVLLLHGWPDTSAVWKKQVPVMVKAGFRVIAPDLRGFGDSDKPEGVHNYALQHVQSDVVSILDQLGVDRFYLVGHDWGSALAWRMASTMPWRVIKLVAMSVGHHGAGFGVQGGARQRQASWYFLFFQYKEAEELLRANDWALFRQFMANDKDAEQMYIESMSRPGALTSGLNWYRANFNIRNYGSMKPARMPQLGIPVMGVWGSRDGACLEGQMKGSERFVKPGLWRYERIEGAAHWLPREVPEKINELLLDFLAPPVPPSRM